MFTKTQLSQPSQILSPARSRERALFTKKVLWGIPLYMLLLAIAVVMVAPFVAMVSVSLQAGDSAAVFPIQWIPTAPTLSNYLTILQTSDIVRWFINSLVVAIVGTVIAIFTATTAAYAFARMNFPLKNVIFWSFLAMLMIPSQITLIPQYLLLAKLDWLNSYQALILPGITSAFGIFLVRQYLLGLPRDFEEAARIDGASEFQIYARIVLPMLKPAIATLATIQFLNYWNDFLYPLVVTTDSSMRTLPAGLATLQTPTSGLPELLAGASIAIVPTVIVFLALQRYFIRGIVMSGLKS
jgi:multiple sugar transport system permease protein